MFRFSFHGSRSRNWRSYSELLTDASAAEDSHWAKCVMGMEHQRECWGAAFRQRTYNQMEYACIWVHMTSHDYAYIYICIHIHTNRYIMIYIYTLTEYDIHVCNDWDTYAHPRFAAHPCQIAFRSDGTGSEVSTCFSENTQTDTLKHNQ